MLVKKGGMVGVERGAQMGLVEGGNRKLMGKIKCGLMIRIGILKNGMIQGVRVKREKVVGDAMSEVERRRNEMLKG
ncbi:toxic anion resistance protein, partial [Bacillus altitudinis]|uniref:toxic anion resistance protein n=1 Tax=Bacillus altitudinis TaxID=293387 RepID=UPI001643874D